MTQVKILITFEVDGPPVPHELLQSVEDALERQKNNRGLTADDNQETVVKFYEIDLMP
jgi:hypothetical protein